MTTPCVTIVVTINCPVCGAAFAPPTRRRRYCSDACRQAAWRQRQARPHVPANVLRHDTVYECPGCENRYLGQQRCSECNMFCRRLGPGALCPNCDEPVAVSDLIPDPAPQPNPKP